MKLRRKDRVVSICMSHNAGNVRGQQVELNPTLLFMRVTCVITDRTEMAKNLEFEFNKQPTALFEKGVMRKGVKSTLAHILQKHATVVTSAPPGSHFVIDGGYLLHLVLWPKDCTYAGVCNNYVEFVLKLFGQDTSVVFDGYTDTSINTKTCEQDRRASRTTSPDIIVGLDTDVTVKQAAFLNNRKNKTQFIHLLNDIFEQNHIVCFQSDGDVDYLICQTAMTKALIKQPVVLVGNDTDLLVILIHSVTKDLNISMQTSTKPNTVYSIAEIQNALSDDVKSNILLAHAITGCDAVSALYNIGKQKGISVLQNTNDDFTALNVSKERNASHHQIASAGEHLMLKLYGAKKAESLDQMRHLRYMQRVSRKSVNSDGFQLKLLPPTYAAAKFQSYRAYLTVQGWMGNTDVSATEWGWEIIDGKLNPISTDRAAAPERVLKIISCGCKVTCRAKCKCQKAGLFCSAMCSACCGQTCENSTPISNDA